MAFITNFGSKILAILYLFKRTKLNPLPTKKSHIDPNLIKKLRKYIILIRKHQDEHGFIETDECDSVLFSGLISIADLKINLKAARDEDGMWHRRPLIYPECWRPESNKGSTISRDMLLGVLWHIWVTQNLKMAEELWDYGIKNSWIMGYGDISRIYLTPGLQATLADIIYKLGGKNHRLTRAIPQMWSKENRGYAFHLDLLHIELRAQVMGGMTDDMLLILNNYYSREPMNPLVQVLYAKYISGNGAKASELLMREDWFPSDRLPTEKDRYARWLPERSYYQEDGSISPDYLPGSGEKSHSGGDLIFCAQLLLDWFDL
ncbi:MAG: hypothetical protein QXL01_01530 [Thermoplasmatales archaeon]